MGARGQGQRLARPSIWRSLIVVVRTLLPLSYYQVCQIKNAFKIFFNVLLGRLCPYYFFYALPYIK